ncbi:hypothetical protein KSS87_007139 [Heliosperma pusillum]|nr:hypothetical protein KSS87_007139 [Heliosperma pusillum]
MAIPAAAVMVPLGLLFILSGLAVNVIQATCFVLVRPLSKNSYRRINRWVAELLWLELVWLVDWWARVQVKIFTDTETFQLMGKEHALVMSNHRSDIDWLVGWVLAQASCLGSTLAVMKKSSKFLPIGLERLKDYPLPFWLALFVEGTRFTQAKLLAAQEYATSTGLPVPRNVLIPRTKGFVTAVSHMRSFVPAIYDITVAIPKSSLQPTMLRLFKGQSSVVHVHITRHKLKDLPETDEAVAQWCRDAFVAKDALLDKHAANDTFGNQLLQTGTRPWKSLVVVSFWVLGIVLGVVRFLRWSSLLSSWKGLSFSVAALGVVTVVMHVLISFSQAERSGHAKVAPEKQKNVGDSASLKQDKQQ